MPATKTKLNQIIALEKGLKSTAESDKTRVYHTAQKGEIFAGLQRTYSPKDDEGEALPGEAQKVIATVPDLVLAWRTNLTRLFDVSATKIYANTKARADVVVNGTTLLEKVPVEYLLFLEKQLIDTMTFVSKLPTLDPAYDWEWSDAQGHYVTKPQISHRSKKVMRNHLKAPATDKHAAQVDVYTEDETVGYWEKVLLSGAVPVTKVTEWKEKVAALQAAVKFAREEANSTEVDDQKVGKIVFDFLFA